MSSSRVLVDQGSFYEGPRWHDDRWWVSDFFRHAVFSFDADGVDLNEELRLDGDGQPSGLGWTPDGDLLVVSMLDQRLLRRDADGVVSVVADFSEHCGGPANDMVVSADGRAYIGNFGFDMSGGAPANANLVRVDADGSVHLAATDMGFPNGSVITPDGSTLIVGESMAARYTAFTITADGSLTDRRIWAEVAGVFPDGCALDAEGRIWCANAGGRGCVLVAEGGEIVDELPSPEGQRTYACMLGGPDGRTLLQCCAPDFGEHRNTATDACLVATEVAVPHAGRP